VAWNSAVRRFSGSLRQDNIGGDMPLGLVSHSSTWLPQGTTGSQTGDEFTLEHATALNKQ
jgi:hypothetical protein